MLGFRKADKLTITDVLRLTKSVKFKVGTSGTTEREVTPQQLANVLSPAEMVETLTAAKTLTNADHNKTFMLSLAGGFAVTLPALESGLRFKFFVATAPSGGAYTIVSAGGADVIVAGVNELEVDTGDDGPYSAAADTITFADGVAVVGDYVELVCDGTKWYGHGQTNADGGATLTAT